jgi:hypothetical protein
VRSAVARCATPVSPQITPGARDERCQLPQIGAPGNDLRARDAGPIRDRGRALEIVAAAGQRDSVTRRVFAPRDLRPALDRPTPRFARRRRMNYR